jgi:hypothetical protein
MDKNPSRFHDIKSRPSELPQVSLIRKSEISINIKEMNSKASILGDKNLKQQKSHFAEIENYHSPKNNEILRKNIF